MKQQNASLPSYTAPPLVEVAMSIQFDPPKGLNQAHLGAFWVTQKQSLPHVRTLRPIASSVEAFGDQSQWLPPSLRLALTDEPDCRLQMASIDDQWLCQVQRDRLVVNWRKRASDYPRFDATWERMTKAWQAWLKFVQAEELPLPTPRLWEITYVNRIPQGTLWHQPDDWPRVFPGLWGGFSTVAGASLRGFQGQWIWESTNPCARLYIEAKPGRSVEEPSTATLLVNLTARGPITCDTPGTEFTLESTWPSIENGMNWGHQLIVGTFDHIISDSAKMAWGRNGSSD